MNNDKDYSWIIVLIIFALIFWAASSDGGSSPYGPGCYDVDPTQYVDVVCE
jgi:hypothetical protein